VHEMFIDLVRSRRGAKLPAEAGELFSGAFWVGTEAVGLGLVDALGDLRTVMRERYGEKVELRVIPPTKPSLIARFLNRPPLAPESLFDPRDVLAAMEERAAWARLGL
jgi:ClpP class serine protease